MFVRNWMSAPAVTVDSETSAPEALKLLEQRGFRRLPVADAGRLVGIVTKVDLQEALGPVPAAWARLKLKVADVMVKNPVSVEAGETLEAVAKLMLTKKIAGLPVVEEDRVVGLITESDVFRALCEILGFEEPGARVTFTVPEHEDLLDEIRKRTAGLQFRTLSGHFNKASKGWEVVARLRSRAPARAAK
jgi:acetoin utilization protein AcuB